MTDKKTCLWCHRQDNSEKMMNVGNEIGSQWFHEKCYKKAKNKLEYE